MSADTVSLNEIKEETYALLDILEMQDMLRARPFVALLWDLENNYVEVNVWIEVRDDLRNITAAFYVP